MDISGDVPASQKEKEKEKEKAPAYGGDGECLSVGGMWVRVLRGLCLWGMPSMRKVMDQCLSGG